MSQLNGMVFMELSITLDQSSVSIKKYVDSFCLRSASSID